MTAEREAMTPRELADRIKNGEKWKMVEHETMTLEQVRDELRGIDTGKTGLTGKYYHVNKWEALLADAIDAHLSRAAEPVAWRWRFRDAPNWPYHYEEEKPDRGHDCQPLYTNPPEPARDAKDSARLDSLEADIAKYGPITLHNGEGIKACQRGLGMANIGRSLRDAIDGMTGSDAAMAQESGE